MTLRNRVAPTGEIVTTQHRGLFTGNRGIIHDPQTKTLVRRWSNRAWLVCLLEFQNRRRAVWAGRHWTELFFLDEATALAAGHRPCFHCRRQDANLFRTSWEAGNKVADVRASEIDSVLHRERLDKRVKRLHRFSCAVSELPDGAMVQADDQSYLIVNGRALLWTWSGYRETDQALSNARLLTPPSTIQALRAGYSPMLHPSATHI